MRLSQSHLSVCQKDRKITNFTFFLEHDKIKMYNVLCIQ